MVTYDTLQQCIQPVIFRTGIKETPVSTWGTGFSLGTKSRVFFVSARHVIRGMAPDDVCVLSPSGRLVPLKDSYSLHPDLSTDDWADVVIHEVPLADGIQRAPDTRLIHLGLAGGDWVADAATSRFFVVGFPNEHSGVDYDVNEVYGGLVELAGVYAGPAAIDGYTHRLTIPHTLGLTTFSGLSGSPVLMLKRTIGERDRFILTGMAIQGTTQAGTMLFVDRTVITSVIESKARYEKKNATGVEPFSGISML
jgi:hypothetical protein